VTKNCFKVVGQDVKCFDLDGAHPVSVDIYEDKTEPCLKNFERRDEAPSKTFKRYAFDFFTTDLLFMSQHVYVISYIGYLL
jgi:hypothetical protein